MKNQPKRLQYSTVRKAVVKTCEEYKLDLEQYEIDSIAKDLKAINDIIADSKRKGGFVSDKLFAICEKEPRGNLDSGRHYYSVHYIKDGSINKAWFWGGFIKVLGGYVQNRDMHLDKYIFGSGAIGMSRLLDATDGLFSYLRRIGGYYTQIDCR